MVAGISPQTFFLFCRVEELSMINVSQFHNYFKISNEFKFSLLFQCFAWMILTYQPFDQPHHRIKFEDVLSERAVCFLYTDICSYPQHLS